MNTGLPEYIGREVVHVSAYEIIMIFLGVIGLLISSCGLLIALLTFLDKRNKQNLRNMRVDKKSEMLYNIDYTYIIL